MNRRHLALGGAAAAALAAGLSWRLLRQPAWVDEGNGFWQMGFPTPAGGSIEAASLRGQALLLNFWGTWCPPCVKEMPELDAFAREFGSRGWRVLGLAVDNPRAVREFLARSPVGYTIGLAGFEGSELARKLGNLQSGLPFTVAFNAQGAISHRKLGATQLSELRSWATTG